MLPPYEALKLGSTARISLKLILHLFIVAASHWTASGPWVWGRSAHHVGARRRKAFGETLASGTETLGETNTDDNDGSLRTWFRLETVMPRGARVYAPMNPHMRRR